MNMYTVALLFLYTISTIASCPCHIPCTNKQETCTCFGPCGDDGYGCKTNGDDHDFLSQMQCGENQFIVQCIRRSQCSSMETLDDTNPFAAYKEAANNMLMESFDDEFDKDAHSSARSLSWFGGNWFDFWGKNEEQFFNQDLDKNDNAENMQNIKSNEEDDDDDEISIDNKDIEPIAASSPSSLSKQTLSKHKDPIADDLDLGRNAAGYKIIALPLYILIICIVSASLIGMVACAGFVYCGLKCCCPLPPASPTLTSQQRSLTLNNISLLQSLTLGGRRNKGYSSEHSVYHRMRHALHNPTNEETSSVASAVQQPEDEYVDSEDDKKENVITMGGDVYDYDMRRTPFALQGTCDSDIDRDSEDEYEATLSALIQIPLQRDHVEEEEENEEKETVMHTIEDPYAMSVDIRDDDEEEYSAQEIDEDEESGDEVPDEGTPLIINTNSNDISSGSGSGSGSANNSNLP